jgi:molecular chaperone GrpE
MVKRARKDSIKEPSDFQDKPEKEKISEKEDDLTIKLKEKDKEAAENYDKYIRTVAELENIKKRAAREKADSIKYGNENLIKDILPMVDSLDRALKQAGNAGDIEAFRKGLKLVQDQLHSCLEKHGVEQIECLDQTFDPNFHEAMFQIESDTHKDNQIVDELEKGYLLNGRLLRPAKVTVCKQAKNEDCEDKNFTSSDNKEEK